MDAQRRELGRAVKRLRAALEARAVQGFAEELQKVASEDLLAALREQKLLLKAHPADRSAVLAELRATAERILAGPEADNFLAYLHFVGIWDVVYARCAKRLSSVLHILPKMGIGQLLEIFEEAVERFPKVIPRRPQSEGLTVAEYERSLHDYNGLAVDVVYAGFRALNQASRVALSPIEQRGLSRNQREMALRRLLKATQISSELNGLEWVLDCVTYGDFVVSKVENGPVPRAHFGYADARRSLLRVLAIRRDLVINLNRARGPRHVQEMLKASEASLLGTAVEHYADLAGIDPTKFNEKDLFDQSAAILALVRAEDDFLVAAGASGEDPRPATSYLAAMSLQWFELAAAAVRRTLPRGRRRLLAAPVVPIHEIEADIARGGGVRVAEAMKNLVSALPARSHFDLVRRPFIRLPGGETRCLTAGRGRPWTATVRETLISGGAIGDAYGRMWETFYTQSFEESNWLVVGRNLTLRRAGEAVTDVDLLLKREKLLLVVQVKALIGSGLTTYDHWRNRRTIEWGCRQAAAATEFIRAHPSWLVSVTGPRVAGEICQVQPLVLTNVSAFEGWQFGGVPIIGEVGRTAITKGAKVDYRDPQSGAVVSTRWITRPEELSTERILWSLNNPVELLIAPESLEIRHRAHTVAGMRILLPEFRPREDVEGFPATLQGASG
jgi:hypothetical protein